MAPKAGKADVLQQKSPAEFFADNRTIAGFDNVSRRWLPADLSCPPPRPPCQRASCRRRRRRPRPPNCLAVPCRPACLPVPVPVQPGKCLYTTIRELVENALDAAESISQLPDIDITVCVTSQEAAPAAARGRRCCRCCTVTPPAPACCCFLVPPTTVACLPAIPCTQPRNNAARRSASTR